MLVLSSQAWRRGIVAGGTAAAIVLMSQGVNARLGEFAGTADDAPMATIAEAPPAVVTAVVDSLWPVPLVIPDGYAQLWAKVRNTGAVPLPAGSVVTFWSSLTSADVGSVSTAGLAAGASKWYKFDLPIPAAAPWGITRNYWAQPRRAGDTSGPWKGPQNFLIGFLDEFSSTMAGWVPVSGAWSIAGSNWLYTPGLSNSSSSARHTEVTKHLDYTVRAWRNGCATCANRIVVRGTVAPLGAGNAWNSEFSFQWARDGSFSVYKTVAGVTTALQNWTTTPAIVNGWNIVQVKSNANSFQFYINGILVWTGYDASLPTPAQLGVGMFRDVASAGNGFWVDYAFGIPEGLGTDSPSGTISEEQLQLNAQANENPRGTVDHSGGSQ